MEKTIIKQVFCFALFLLCFTASIPSTKAYKNYTVGGSLGWFDKLAKPDVDYDKWVAGKTFSLGDFLIFNTDNNHSVIQTRTFATYNSCDSQGETSTLWSMIQPNSTEVHPVTVSVPLLKEGSTYFFSGDYDGEQCINGQRFQINVTHGQGLPPSLKNNPDFAVGPSSSNPAPGPSNPEAGDDQPTPDIVSSDDFKHPKNIPEDSTSENNEDEDDTKKSNSASAFSVGAKLLGYLVGGILIQFLIIG